MAYRLVRSLSSMRETSRRRDVSLSAATTGPGSEELQLVPVLVVVGVKYVSFSSARPEVRGIVGTSPVYVGYRDVRFLTPLYVHIRYFKDIHMQAF